MYKNPKMEIVLQNAGTLNKDNTISTIFTLLIHSSWFYCERLQWTSSK